MKRPKPIRDVEDAVTWLAYWSRFTTGDMSRNMSAILDVLVRMDLEMSEVRERCAAIAKRLETLEAKGEGL